jgi:hypothetical protein
MSALLCAALLCPVSPPHLDKTSVTRQRHDSTMPEKA